MFTIEHRYWAITIITAILTAIAKCQSMCQENRNGCMTCWDAYACDACLAGWYRVTSSTQICEPCMPGCTSCSSSSNCVVCEPGFFLKSSVCQCPKGRGINLTTRKCSACAVSNCATCYNDYQVCTSCVDNYGYDSATTSCQPCTVSKCIKCPDSPSVCQSCITGYATSGSSSCQTCQYFMSKCLTCISNSQCTSCAVGYGVSSSTCYSCSISACLQCSQNVYRCTKCQDNYGLQISSTSTNIYCRICLIQNCERCGNDYKICDACYSGFVLKAQGYCTNCLVINCINCNGNPSQCQSCYSGYGVITPSKQCVKCAQPNCIKCSANYNVCNACGIGYGLMSGKCQKCTKSNCLQCPTNNSYCTACQDKYGPYAGDCNLCWSTCSLCKTYDWKCSACLDGYGISTTSPTCDKCAMDQCLTCPNDYFNQCTSCKQAYGISSGQCVACTNDLCYECSNDANTCTGCINGYGASGGVCQPCSDSRCMMCPKNPSICISCSQGFGVSSGNCINCQKSGCRICSKDAYFCEVCFQTFLLSAGSCQKCLEPHCQKCTSGCIKCMPGYGLDSGTCQPCVSIHCQSCPLSSSTCQVCRSPYALKSATCVPCASPCQTCHQFNDTKCFSCIKGYYLQNYVCLVCQSYCVECSNGKVCQMCQDGYYANLAGSCIACPMYCYTCNLYTEYDVSTGTTTQYPSCLSCDPLSQPSHILPYQCIQICGDQITNVYPCDTPNGIQFDGCTDQCQVQDDFVCNTTTICSYTGILDLRIDQIVQYKFQNKLTIKVDIYPPLFVFKLAPQDLTKVFKTNDPDLQFTSVIFDPTTNQLIFQSDFKADFINRTFQIFFYPAGSTNPRYQFSIDQQAILVYDFRNTTLPYYYTPMSFVAAKSILYLSYMLVALAWIAVILGVFARRMAGLEAMIVVQFSWINIVWINSNYLYTQFLSVEPLKLSTFFNVPLLAEQPPTFSMSPPFTTQFSLSPNYFVNNFNLCLILQFIPLCYLFVVFAKIRYELFKNRHDAEFLKEEKPIQFKKLQLHRQYALQCVMYFTMFNLSYLVCCSVLYVKKGNLNVMPSLIMFITCISFSLLVFLKFIVDPDPFGYLRYSFRYTAKSCFYELSFRHYLVYSTVLISNVLLITLLPQISFLSLILLIVFMLFTLIYHPYKEHKENYRSAFNIFIMACMVSIRVYIQYYPPPFHNSIGFNLMLIIVYCVFLTICVIYGLASTIYHIIYICYLRQKKLEESEQFKADRQKGKIYEMIQITDVNTKMRDMQIRQELNILKKMKKSKLTLTQYSNQLYRETIQSQRQFFKDTTLRRPINLVIDTQISQANLNPHYFNKRPQKLKTQIVHSSYGQELSRQRKKKEKEKNVQLTSLQKTTQSILAQENVHINLKSTFMKYSDGINRQDQKHHGNFVQAYDQIQQQPQNGNYSP